MSLGPTPISRQSESGSVRLKHFAAPPDEMTWVAVRHLEEERMDAETSATQTRVLAIHTAVEPYGWRALTSEMVARLLLGAVDCLLVLEVIGATPGGSAPDIASVEPTDRGDDRIEPLVQLMASFRWRDVTLTRLVQILLEALDEWWLCRDTFENELGRLLDEQR
jgi:hypothetical protein